MMRVQREADGGEEETVLKQGVQSGKIAAQARAQHFYLFSPLWTTGHGRQNIRTWPRGLQHKHCTKSVS